MVETTGLDLHFRLWRKLRVAAIQLAAAMLIRIATNLFESLVETKRSSHPFGWELLLVETTGLEPVTSCV